VRIVVHDDGTGVASELLPRLTRPFFSTKAGATKNRGLGLFVASRVIGMHSGELALESDGASYTDVVITLPAATATGMLAETE
jgi:signal transduction histidine kinase